MVTYFPLLFKKKINSFTEILFTCHKIYLFAVYNSMIFSQFADCRFLQSSVILEHYHHPEKIPYAHLESIPAAKHLQPFQPALIVQFYNLDACMKRCIHFIWV